MFSSYGNNYENSLTYIVSFDITIFQSLRKSIPTVGVDDIFVAMTTRTVCANQLGLSLYYDIEALATSSSEEKFVITSRIV